MQGNDAPLSGSVVLVHGIHSTGEWYPHAITALTPHFLVFRALYEGYEVPGLGAWRTAVFGRAFKRKAIEEVRVKFGSARLSDKVSVLAHSWGTFITLNAIRSDQAEAFERVVFVGTPLARAVAWKEKGVRSRVLSIDNIMLTEDEIMVPLHRTTSIPYLGAVLGWAVLPKDIGGGGAGSFEAVSGDLHQDDVHTHYPKGASPGDWKCPKCAGTRAWLHNWRFTGTHTELLKRWDRFARIVRPLLWGIPPAEYGEWLQHCGDLSPWFGRRKNLSIASSPLPEVSAPGFTRRDVERKEFSARMDRFLKTRRSFLYGETFGLILECMTSETAVPKEIVTETVQHWALSIAEKTIQARVRDWTLWQQVEQELEQGKWQAPPEGAFPDPKDERFPLHPGRALDTLKQAIRSGAL